MKKAFTLVEILIVATILGILAALVLPTFQDHVQRSKESAAKENLRILRNAIGLYAAQHNGIAPGYHDNDPTQGLSKGALFEQLITSGEYLQQFPENPFNGYGFSKIRLLDDEQDFPEEATGEFGWIYRPATKQIRLDWPGTDSQGVRYYDY